MQKLIRGLLFSLLTLPLLAQTGSKTPAEMPSRLEVTVHPGIELFTIVQRLANQYPTPTKSAYANSVNAYFAPFANHPAVQHIKKMGQTYPDLAELGYCFDQFPTIRIHYPDSLHWYAMYGKDTVQTYMKLCHQFFADTHFWAFYQSHQADYAAWAKPVQARLASEGLVAKLDSFYRFQQKAAHWTIFLDPLNSWGAHAIMAKTLNPRYADHVVYNIGYFNREAKDTSMPEFSVGTEGVTMVWHEGSHLYTSDLQKRYKADILKLAYLFNKDDSGMKRNNITTWKHCFDENLVRGIVIALFRQYHSPKEARKQAAREIVGDFQYAGDIADVLSTRYIGQTTYTNFEQFFPQILNYLAQKYPTAELTTR